MKKSVSLARGGMIAALYVLLTFFSALLGLSSGPVQLRLSESLTVLPFYLPEAVPGLAVGCVLANLLTGAPVWDVAFGSLATLLGAFGTRYLAKKPWQAPLWPILTNTLIVPQILRLVYQAEGTLWYFTLTVFAGESLSCGVLGLLTASVWKRTSIRRDRPR